MLRQGRAQGSRVHFCRPGGWSQNHLYLGRSGDEVIGGSGGLYDGCYCGTQRLEVVASSSWGR
eukprot:1994773-Lingulodinium_polyedra.AAC.1